MLRSSGYSVRQNIDLVGYPKMAIKQSWACYGAITSRKELAPWSYHLSEWPRFCSAQCGITSRKGLPSCWLTATTPQGNASLHNRITSRNGLGTCGISSQHRACSKLVTLKAIPASYELGNSLSFRGCTPINQRLPYCVGMFCRFFKIQEAKQIKQETRNFGKIAKKRAKISAPRPRRWSWRSGRCK